MSVNEDSRPPVSDHPMRFAMLTWVDVDIACTPSPLAITNPYSMSSSVMRLFML